MATHSSIVAWRIPGLGTWWAAIYGVAQSWTQLKRLSSSSSSMSYMKVVKRANFKFLLQGKNSSSWKDKTPGSYILLLLLSRFSCVQLCATP